MAKELKTAPKSETKPVEPGSEIGELVSLLVATNRIAAHLETTLSNSGSTVTLTDWLLLHTLNADGPLAVTRVATKIGVTRQRVHQQISALKAAGLLDVTSAEDSKSKTLSIGSGAGALLKRLEQDFREALSAEDDGMPTGPIHTASMAARRIARAITPKREPKPEGKRGGLEKG